MKLDYNSLESIQWWIEYLEGERYELQTYLEQETPELDEEIRQLESLASYLEYKSSK